MQAPPFLGTSTFFAHPSKWELQIQEDISKKGTPNLSRDIKIKLDSKPLLDHNSFKELGRLANRQPMTWTPLRYENIWLIYT